MILKDELLPSALIPVERLVKEAGIDVSSWRKNQKDECVEENGNVYKNFLWAFGGGSDPVALCVWHKEIDWDSQPPARAGNFNSMLDGPATCRSSDGMAAQRGSLR